MFSRASLYRSILGGQNNTTGDFKEVYFLHILYILFDIFYLEVDDELDSVSKNGPFAKLCTRAVARALIGGGGGCIFIYSGSARLVSFEIKLISKEASRAEPEYMNIHPPN